MRLLLEGEAPLLRKLLPTLLAHKLDAAVNTRNVSLEVTLKPITPIAFIALKPLISFLAVGFRMSSQRILTSEDFPALSTLSFLPVMDCEVFNKGALKGKLTSAYRTHVLLDVCMN